MAWEIFSRPIFKFKISPTFKLERKIKFYSESQSSIMFRCPENASKNRTNISVRCDNTTHPDEIYCRTQFFYRFERHLQDLVVYVIVWPLVPCR